MFRVPKPSGYSPFLAQHSEEISQLANSNKAIAVEVYLCEGLRQSKAWQIVLRYVRRDKTQCAPQIALRSEVGDSGSLPPSHVTLALLR